MYGYPYYAQPMPDQLAQLRQNPMYQQQQALPYSAPQQQTGITWVQGENAAKSYPVANGSTVTLWDSEQQTIYIKSADATGMPTMKIIDYTERVQASKTPCNATNEPDKQYVTRDEFNALVARMNAYEAPTGNDSEQK